MAKRAGWSEGEGRWAERVGREKGQEEIREAIRALQDRKARGR